MGQIDEVADMRIRLCEVGEDEKVKVRTYRNGHLILELDDGRWIHVATAGDCNFLSIETLFELDLLDADGFHAAVRDRKNRAEWFRQLKMEFEPAEGHQPMVSPNLPECSSHGLTY
jgi:hypothetical protein